MHIISILVTLNMVCLILSAVYVVVKIMIIYLNKLLNKLISVLRRKEV